MAPSKTPDELADALFDTAPERYDHMAIVAYRTQLRQLARDSAALGAVEAEANLAEVVDHFRKDGPATFFRWMDAQGFAEPVLDDAAKEASHGTE